MDLYLVYALLRKGGKEVSSVGISRYSLHCALGSGQLSRTIITRGNCAVAAIGCPSSFSAVLKPTQSDMFSVRDAWPVYLYVTTILPAVLCVPAHAHEEGNVSSPRSDGLFTQESRDPDHNCDSFSTLANSFTADGDYTMLVYGGHSTTPRHCQQVCVLKYERSYCMAAVSHVNGSCFLVGYKLWRDRKSKHFRRVCDGGRKCFKLLSGWESRYHTGIIFVPELALGDDFLMADFCRSECEHLSTCRAFDVRSDLDYCPFIELRPSHSDLFRQMSLRSCANSSQLTI